MSTSNMTQIWRSVSRGPHFERILSYGTAYRASATLSAEGNPEMNALEDAIEIVKIGAPYRTYSGDGGMWCGQNRGIADANFDDWGLARATAAILNAVVEGRLTIEIERAELIKALQPFANYAEARDRAYQTAAYPDTCPLCYSPDRPNKDAATVGDLRRARALLEKLKPV